jgi:cell wall-associated NlpC family hydrolase
VLRAFVVAGVVSLPLTLAAQEEAKRAESPGPSSVIVRPPTAAERAALRDQAHRDSVVRMARSQLGRRYIFGGTTPRGFDCSGFTRYLMRALGYDVPRTAAQQARVGRAIPKDPRLLRPGDLLTFGRGNRVTHIGVYVGDGKYIHASSGQGRVVESRLDRPGSHLVRAWYGVRRLLTEGDTTTAVAAARVLPGTTRD